jgi:hypothetical protein
MKFQMYTKRVVEKLWMTGAFPVDGSRSKILLGRPAFGDRPGSRLCKRFRWPLRLFGAVNRIQSAHSQTVRLSTTKQ